MFRTVVVTLCLMSAANSWALALKPEYLKRMTYSQCITDPTARFVASYQHQRYPNLSFKTILHITCQDAGK